MHIHVAESSFLNDRDLSLAIKSNKSRACSQ
jgi:hypothetical protein